MTKAEVAGLMKFVAIAKSEKLSTEQGIQLALEAMLVSPEFLFRLERDTNPTDPEKTHRLSDVELATRLSYFLWSSMPDDELLNLAESNKLSQPAVLEAQVKRMMADKKAGAFAANFAGQWLEVPQSGFDQSGPEIITRLGPGSKRRISHRNQYVLPV